MVSIFTNQTKNTATFTKQSKSTSGGVTATAGLVYGFGAFTYSGGQLLSTGALPVFTNQTKN